MPVRGLHTAIINQLEGHLYIPMLYAALLLRMIPQIYSMNRQNKFLFIEVFL